MCNPYIKIFEYIMDTQYSEIYKWLRNHGEDGIDWCIEDYNQQYVINGMDNNVSVECDMVVKIYNIDVAAVFEMEQVGGHNGK